MKDTQHEIAQALAEKSWIEDRLNEVRVRNEQGIPISIGDIETLLMMALDQGRALQIGVPIIEDIDRLLDEKEALQQDRDAYSRKMVRLERALGIAKEGLEKAIETIESWHNMHLPFDLKEGLWELYQQSPEMKRINAALKAATEELQK